MPQLKNREQAWASYEALRADPQQVPVRSLVLEHGRIKFFHPGKFGIITSDAGDDVFLGAKVAEHHGINPWNGDAVAFTRAPPLRGDCDVATNVRITAPAPRETGHVRAWLTPTDGKQSFGFIRSDQMVDDVYVGEDALRMNGYDTLTPGKRVEFARTRTAQGRSIAWRLRVIN